MGFDVDKMVEELKLDEGKAPGDRGYVCSAGYWTIGYGHNIETNPIPEHIAEGLLSYDIGIALGQCERFDWFYPLSDTRKRVIVNMVFNIGANGVSKFVKMIAAIEAKDFNTASQEMIRSKWCRDVGDRAHRLAVMMEWDDEFWPDES